MVFFRTGSNPHIKKNKIFGGKNGGVLIYNSGKIILNYLSEIILFTDQERAYWRRMISMATHLLECGSRPTAIPR